MDSNWVHGRASYRCRHGRSSAQAPDPASEKILYWREDVLLRWLATALGSAERGAIEPESIPGLLRESGRNVVCNRATAELGSIPPGGGP
ncbi:hypothetical protein LZG04_11355 [Saccharothrix sp. S26]|nr:hypothetical protein [Saccharothrix sp. S26]